MHGIRDVAQQRDKQPGLDSFERRCASGSGSGMTQADLVFKFPPGPSSRGSGPSAPKGEGLVHMMAASSDGMISAVILGGKGVARAPEGTAATARPNTVVCSITSRSWVERRVEEGKSRRMMSVTSPSCQLPARRCYLSARLSAALGVPQQSQGRSADGSRSCLFGGRLMCVKRCCCGGSVKDVRCISFNDGLT